MIKIVNGSEKQFYNNAKEKLLFLFGAGKKAGAAVNTYCKGLNITAIVDNNLQIQKTNMVICGKTYKIIDIKEFVEYVLGVGSDRVLLLITPTFYAWSIVEQLNNIPQLKGLQCYLSVLLGDYYERIDFSFSQGEPKIPKKIHYCWFGKGEIPVHLKNYIASWHKFCPEYEIIRWDEKNYNINKIKYIKEAYRSKKWGFVSDYARLDVIYQEGGIYLDTDVELIASLDKMINDEMFMGAYANYMIASGVGIGAVKAHPLIKELRDYYDDKSFYRNDGRMNLTPCQEYQHPVLVKYGFSLENKYQMKNNIVIYPSEVMSPTGISGLADNFTENTISIHHGEWGWISKAEKEAFERYREALRNSQGNIENNI